MTVCCVLRSGGDFAPEHVTRLYEQVRQHWAGDRFLDFVCLTDTRIGRHGIREVPLVNAFPGWWSKAETLRPDVFRGTALYLDLDTTVMGDLSPLFGYGGAFAMLSDFYRPRNAQSGALLFQAGPGTVAAGLWSKFTADPAGHMKQFRGDGEWLHANVRPDRLQDLYPGWFVSYKVHCSSGVPAGARVVAFHGKPRPWEVAA